MQNSQDDTTQDDIKFLALLNKRDWTDEDKRFSAAYLARTTKATLDWVEPNSADQLNESDWEWLRLSARKRWSRRTVERMDWLQSGSSFTSSIG